MLLTWLGLCPNSVPHPFHSPQEKESESSSLSQQISVLAARMQELSAPRSLDPTAALAALQKKLWDVESSATEQQEELSSQARTIEQLEQVRGPEGGHQAQPPSPLGSSTSLALAGAESCRRGHRSGATPS